MASFKVKMVEKHYQPTVCLKCHKTANPVLGEFFGKFEDKYRVKFYCPYCGNFFDIVFE